MIRSTVLFILFVFLAAGCESPIQTGGQAQEKVKPVNITGNYVSDGYNLRQEGYDWVGVSVTGKDDSTFHISVRSRADKKNPTCFLDLDALQIGPSKLRAYYEGREIIFNLRNDSLLVIPADEESRNLLYWFCSGGATLEGSYVKIDGPLDATQVDETLFLKYLNWDKYSFEVRVIGDMLTIHPVGLEIDNSTVSHEIEGQVTGAEIGDLNIDGYPEVMVYLTSGSNGGYGSIIGYSVNNGKSMSQVFMPKIKDNDEVNQGYRGHDEFAIVESTLVRRFPIYTPGDVNAEPTGRMRQLQYKLVDGENMRRFVIDKVVEY